MVHGAVFVQLKYNHSTRTIKYITMLFNSKEAFNKPVVNHF